MMPLDPYQQETYLEEISIYRNDKGKYASGTDPGWVLKYSAVLCKIFTTPNFDEPIGTPIFGQHKQANIVTANKLHVAPDTDIQDGDLIKVTKSLNVGNTPWFLVSGEPETRQGVANRSQVYLVPTPVDESYLIVT